MFRPPACLMLLAGTALELAAAGGSVALKWKDCGSEHGKVTSIQPSSLTLGEVSKVSGSGSIDEDVAKGEYDVKVTAGYLPVWSHSGDLCKPETAELPLGVGSMSWNGLKCPVKSGAVDMGMSFNLSASVPSSLARLTIEVKAKAGNGDNLVCVEIDTAPEEGHETSLEMAPSPADIEKLICQVASQKQAEDKAVDEVCQVITAKLPSVKFNPDCKTAVTAYWDKAVAMCPQGNEAKNEPVSILV